MTTTRGKIVFMAILMMAFTVSVVQGAWEVEQIESVYDDGFIVETGGKFFETPWVQIKGGSVGINSYFAFRGVTLPPDSEIENAYLQFTAPFPWNYNQTLEATLYGIKTGDLTSWNPTPDLTSEPVTTSHTNFDIAPLISGASINVTVTEQVKEIYNLWSWTENNDMGFQVASVAVSGGSRYALAYDSEPLSSAKLFIEFTENTSSIWWYKGYKIENVTAGTTMNFDFRDLTDANSRITTILRTDYETHNLTNSFGDSPDNMASVGDDIYMVHVNKIAPWNKSLFVTSDRGVTWTKKAEIAPNSASLLYGKLNALSYDAPCGIIHIGYGVGTNTLYRKYYLANETVSASVIVYTGGFNSGQVRSLYEPINDAFWITRYGGTPALATRRASVIRAEHDLTFDIHTIVLTERREGDIVWWNGTMRYIYHTYSAVPLVSRLDWISLVDYNLFTWDAPKVIAGAYVNFDAGLWEGDLVLSVERTFPIDEYVYSYRWNGVGWDVWMYNLTGWFPASQPEFHAPKMFYNQDDELWMGLIVEEDAGYSLIYNDWDHFQTPESVPPLITAKVTGHSIDMLGGDMYPYNLALAGWVVTPPTNGTDPNPNCLAQAVTLEDVQACIDAVTSPTPDDPNPPGTTYPPDGVGQLTRFNVRFYIWLMGWVAVFVPMFAMAYRNWGIEYYFFFSVIIVAGVGLLWSIGSI